MEVTWWLQSSTYLASESFETAAWQISWAPRWKFSFCALHEHMGLKDCWNAKMTKLGVVPCNYQKLNLHQTGTATTLPQDRLCGIAQLKNTQIYLDQSIQWLYLRQSILCCTVPVSTLFSWAGRPCLAAFSVLIFQLLLLLTILVLLLSCLMGAQNMPCSEVPPKLWMQLCGYPQRCREDSLESFPGAAGSDSMGPTWISSCPVTPGSPSTCASLCTRPPVQSSQGHQDSGEEVTGEEV